MEVDNAYYKRIVYKKNAYEDLKSYLKINHNNKKILLISTKSVPAEYVTEVLNALFCSSEKISHFVARNNFIVQELDCINKKFKSESYDVLVALGGGKCCEVAKFFAHKYDISYVACPTVTTSLSYFSNYCINPYNSTDSFYAKMPAKVFIQERIIRSSNCYNNIQGLCVLNALRSVLVETMFVDNESEKFITISLEKLFSKLEYEQTDILLCSEDSNLVLMDLFIDFGFFISQLNLEDYYLFNMYKILLQICEEIKCGQAGVYLLLCSNIILNSYNKFLSYKSPFCLEKANYNKFAKLIKNNEILAKNIKNNQFFIDFNKKTHYKVQFLNNLAVNKKLVSLHIQKINNFSKNVKSIYKNGLCVKNDFKSTAQAFALVPYITKGNYMQNIIASSGVLNCFV